MEPRRTLVRRAGIAGAALLLLTAVTACGGTGPVGAAPVATVNGHRIYQDEVLDLVDAQAAYLDVQRAAAAGAGQDAEVERIDRLLEDYRGLTLETASVSEIVGSLAEIEILSGVVRDADEEISDTDRDKSRKDLMVELEKQGITDAEPFEALAKILIERNVLYVEVQEMALRSAYGDNEGNLEELCVRLVVTEDQAAAEAAYERVVAGEDFSTVATEASIDTTSAANGGDIGCVPRAGIANVFGEAATTAKPGDLLAPADGEGSWLFVQVDDVNIPTFEDVQLKLQEQGGLPPEAQDLAAQELLAARDAAAQELLAETFTSAQVTIDPRYGTWNPENGTVVAPVDPAPSTTSTVSMTDPAAIDPSGAGQAGS